MCEAFRQREITSKTNKPPQKPALHRRALNALGGTNRRPRLALTLAATRHVVCGPAPSSQSAGEREWRAITAITTLTGRWEAETAGTHKRKVTGRRGSRLNPNEHTIRGIRAHRAVPDCTTSHVLPESRLSRGTLHMEILHPGHVVRVHVRRRFPRHGVAYNTA